MSARDQHADRRRQPAHRHARRAAEHADRLDDEPAARRSTAPGVREPAADRRAGHARELDEERRGQARPSPSPMWNLSKRNFGIHDSSTTATKLAHMNAPIRQSSVGVRAISRKKPVSDNARRPSRPMRRCAARRFDQEAAEHQPERIPAPPKDDERCAPAVTLGDQPGEKAADDRADVDARLVQAHRARARVAVRDSRRCSDIEAGK